MTSPQPIYPLQTPPPLIDDPGHDLTIFERYHRELWGHDSPSITRINRALKTYEDHLKHKVPTESQARLISEIQDLLKMVVPRLEVGSGLLPPETLVNFLQEWDATLSPGQVFSDLDQAENSSTDR